MYFLYYLIYPVLFVILILVVVISIVISRKNNLNSMNPNQITKPRESFADIFLNIGAIICLYTIVGYLLNLLFTVIEKAYPQINSGSYYYSSTSAISWPVSILIIVFPIFVLLMYFLEKSYILNPEKRHVGVRKGLTYLTLFAGGIVLVGDLVTVIYYFIDGQDLTLGFMMKIISVLAVTLIIFLYYIADIRNKLTSKLRIIFLIIAILMIVASIVWGFAILGSPRTQRLLKHDQQKINDLQSINNSIISYYSYNKFLPINISDLQKQNSYYISTTIDRQTGKPYEYIKTGDYSYEICADFNKDTKELNNRSAQVKDTYIRSLQTYGITNWDHSSGRYCFKQTVKPPVEQNLIINQSTKY